MFLDIQPDLVLREQARQTFSEGQRHTTTRCDDLVAGRVVWSGAIERRYDAAVQRITARQSRDRVAAEREMFGRVAC